MKNKIISAMLMVAMSAGVASTPMVVSAAQGACGQLNARSLFTIEPWYACLETDDDGNPVITSLDDILLVIFPLLEGLIKVGVLVAAGYMFWSFFNMMRAQGDPGKLATAIGGIRDAIIALVLIIVAVPLINFVAGLFTT